MVGMNEVGERVDMELPRVCKVGSCVDRLI